MITKGIIQSIDLTGNTCQVRMPFFESANNDEILGTATISNTPGCYNGYKVGDVVWVGFEDGKLATPVIIGKLYLGVDIEQQDPRGVINVVDSIVANSASIPADTKLEASVENNVAPTSIPHNSVSSISHNLSNLKTNVNSMATEYNNEFRLIASRLDEDGERIAGLIVTADEVKQFAIGVENEVKKEVWARIAGDSNLLKNIKSVKQYFDSELAVKADDIKAEVRSNFLLKDSADAEIEETYAFGWDLQFDKWTVYSKKESSQGLDPANVHLSIKQDKADLIHGLGPGTYYFTNNQGWSDVYCYTWRIETKEDGTTTKTENKPWPGEICPVVGVNTFGQKYHSAIVDSYNFDFMEFNAGRSDLKTDTINIRDSFYAKATDVDIAYDSKFEVEESGNYIFYIDTNKSIDVQEFIGPVPTEGESTNYRCIVNGEELEDLLDIKSSGSTNDAEIILTLKKDDTVIFLYGPGSVEPLDFHRWEPIEEYIHSDLNAVYLKEPISGRPTIPVGFWAARDLAIGNDDATVYIPKIAINGQVTNRVVTDVESLDSFKQLLIAENGYWAWKDITDPDMRSTGVVASEVKDILTASENGLKVNGRIEATDGYIGSFVIGSVRPEDFQSAIHSDSYIEKFTDNVRDRSGIYLGTDGIALGNWQWPDGGRSPAFKVDTLGNLTATRGQFGYLYIGETHWTNGYPHSGLYSDGYVHSFDSPVGAGDCGIYLGSDGIKLGNYVWPNGGASAAFSVDTGGYLMATQGLIGLWNIGPAHTVGDGTIEFSGIYSTGYINRFDQSLYSGQTGLYLGTDGIKLGNYTWPDGGTSAAFSVTPGGELQCTHGHIGTFLIGGKHKVGDVTHSSIHTENYVDQFDWDIHPNNPGVYIGTDGIRLGSGDKEFAVDAEGNIKAESLQVAKYIRVDPYFGAEEPLFEANVNDNSVKMANFYVTENLISAGWAGEDGSVFMSPGTTFGVSLGGSGWKTNWAFGAGDSFGVTDKGELYARDAHVIGKITAQSGTIGGSLTIGSDGLYVKKGGNQIYSITSEGIEYASKGHLIFNNVQFSATKSSETFLSDTSKLTGLKFSSASTGATSTVYRIKVQMKPNGRSSGAWWGWDMGMANYWSFTSEVKQSDGTWKQQTAPYSIRCKIYLRDSDVDSASDQEDSTELTIDFSSSSNKTGSVSVPKRYFGGGGEHHWYWKIDFYTKTNIAYSTSESGTFSGSWSKSRNENWQYWDATRTHTFDSTGDGQYYKNDKEEYLHMGDIYVKHTVNNTKLYCLSNFLPNAKTLDLGSTTEKWNAVFATNLDKDSDRNVKFDITPFDTQFDEIFDNLKPVRYRYKDGGSKRLHMGFIGQEVKEAVEKAGVTTHDFAAYAEYNDPELTENDAHCGLRYMEFIAMNTDQIQKLKKRVVELEDTIKKLENKK